MIPSNVGIQHEAQTQPGGNDQYAYLQHRANQPQHPQQAGAVAHPQRLQWLRGAPRESKIEHDAADLTATVLGAAGSLGCAVLGKAGLHDKAADAVNFCRTKAGDVVDHNATVHGAHVYAQQFWPYVLATRFVGNVDKGVRAKIGRKGRGAGAGGQQQQAFEAQQRGLNGHSRSSSSSSSSSDEGGLKKQKAGGSQKKGSQKKAKAAPSL